MDLTPTTGGPQVESLPALRVQFILSPVNFSFQKRMKCACPWDHVLSSSQVHPLHHRLCHSRAREAADKIPNSLELCSS